MSSAVSSSSTSLPESIERPSAWLGPDMRKTPELWIANLQDAEINELESAARRFLNLGIDTCNISRDLFPLGEFSGRLEELARQLLQGIGFGVLRGLPIDRWPLELAEAVFCGIGAHLGSARSQNAAGDVLGHVRDIGGDASDPGTRIYQTNERQTFHTDSADVVGLLCLRPARRGGESLLVSAESIYNRLRKTRPDLLGLLFDPIATDRRGEVPPGARPYMMIPPLCWHEGLLTVFYQRQYIDSAQRFDGVTPLTDKQVEALDLFDTLANDPDLSFEMQLEAGDIQFVYNHALMHDRKAFTDWPEAERRRHLLRLWLSMPGDRPLPECFSERYGSIEIGNRGGIVVGADHSSVPPGSM